MQWESSVLWDKRELHRISVVGNSKPLRELAHSRVRASALRKALGRPSTRPAAPARPLPTHRARSAQDPLVRSFPPASLQLRLKALPGFPPVDARWRCEPALNFRITVSIQLIPAKWGDRSLHSEGCGDWGVKDRQREASRSTQGPCRSASREPPLFPPPRSSHAQTPPAKAQCPPWWTGNILTYSDVFLTGGPHRRG